MKTVNENDYRFDGLSGKAVINHFQIRQAFRDRLQSWQIPKYLRV
tara:strand:- start:65 stop:199 length:135 start_codon:yes stop_codon:yes gene_type:complete